MLHGGLYPQIDISGIALKDPSFTNEVVLVVCVCLTIQ